MNLLSWHGRCYNFHNSIRLVALKPRSNNMKSTLIETVLVTQSILFWAVALPAACLFMPAAVLCEKVQGLCSRNATPDFHPFLTSSSAINPRIAS